MNDEQKQIAYDIECKMYDYIESNPKKYKAAYFKDGSKKYNVYVELADKTDEYDEASSYVRHKKSGDIYEIAVYKVKRGVRPSFYPGHYGG